MEVAMPTELKNLWAVLKRLMDIVILGQTGTPSVINTMLQDVKDIGYKIVNASKVYAEYCFYICLLLCLIPIGMLSLGWYAEDVNWIALGGTLLGLMLFIFAWIELPIVILGGFVLGAANGVIDFAKSADTKITAGVINPFEWLGSALSAGQTILRIGNDSTDAGSRLGQIWFRRVKGIIFAELIICGFFSILPPWKNPSVIPLLRLFSIILAFAVSYWGIRSEWDKRIIVGISISAICWFTFALAVPEYADAISDSVENSTANRIACTRQGGGIISCFFNPGENESDPHLKWVVTVQPRGTDKENLKTMTHGPCIRYGHTVYLQMDDLHKVIHNSAPPYGTFADALSKKRGFSKEEIHTLAADPNWYIMVTLVPYRNPLWYLIVPRPSNERRGGRFVDFALADGVTEPQKVTINYLPNDLCSGTTVTDIPEP